jgi:3-oxoacyl-[acyl-carrier protein] reductase
MQDRPLAGQAALVTGVSRRRGIGFATAQRLALLGADLMLQALTAYDAQQAWGADQEGMAPLLAELRSHGTRVEYVEADFLEPQAPQRVMEAARTAFGNIDILIANHAYSTDGALEDLTAESIDTHLLVNVRASLLLVKEFAAQYRGQSGGRVILLTSGQALGPMPGELAYVASKGALHQLTQSLSAHLIPRGITVNAINPGPTDTGWADGALYEHIKEAFPQGRWGEPEDAARLIAWLCTDDARWITGQIINSTGGF